MKITVNYQGDKLHYWEIIDPLILYIKWKAGRSSCNVTWVPSETIIPVLPGHVTCNLLYIDCFANGYWKVALTWGDYKLNLVQMVKSINTNPS